LQPTVGCEADPSRLPALLHAVVFEHARQDREGWRNIRLLYAGYPSSSPRRAEARRL